MTGDATRDREATPHDFNSLPSSDYAAERQVREAKAAARDRREAEQKARMDAAHEKAKAEKEARIPVKRQHCGTCGTLQRIEYLDVRGRCESCAEQLPLFKELP